MSQYSKNRGIKTFFYERTHNYTWSIGAYLVDQKKDGKKGCKQTN